MREIWQDVKGFEGRYQVSNFGKVRSYISNHNGKNDDVVCNHILKDADNKGYRRVVLIDENGKRHSCTVHRLVAFAFIGDCTDLEINHKDGDKTNNHVDNLEICNQSYNTIHAYRLGLMKPCNNGLWKSIKLFKDGLFIGTFVSIREMCRQFNFDRKAVQRTIKGEYKHHHGYTFELI